MRCKADISYAGIHVANDCLSPTDNSLGWAVYSVMHVIRIGPRAYVTSACKRRGAHWRKDKIGWMVRSRQRVS